MAGARGDFVNTWVSQWYLINGFAPVLYLGKSHTDLLALNTEFQQGNSWLVFPLVDMLIHTVFR